MAGCFREPERQRRLWENVLATQLAKAQLQATVRRGSEDKSKVAVGAVGTDPLLPSCFHGAVWQDWQEYLKTAVCIS